MNKSKAIETLRSTRDDPRHFPIGQGVVGMKCGEQYGAIDARPGGTQQIFFQRSVSVPRTRQPVALSRMTVAIDNHGYPSGDLCARHFSRAKAQRRKENL